MTCTSIEHNPEWYQLVRKQLEGASWLDLRLVEPEPVSTTSNETDWADPRAYRSSDEKFWRYTFHSYATQIDEFPDRYFDIILIDGRVRPSCLMHSISKVKKDGILILDNADRPSYLERTKQYFEEFQHLQFSGLNPLTPWPSRTDVLKRSK